MAQAAQHRIWLETTEGGYLMPVGVALGSVDDQEQKQQGGLNYTPKPAKRLFLQGVAVNQDNGQTAQQVFEAMKAFVDFFSANYNIIRIVLCEADGQSPMGGVANSLPGNQIEEYLPAYEGNTVQRWEVMDYAIEEITLPFHFNCRVMLQNFPVLDAEVYDFGKTRAFDFAADRDITNGVATYRATFNLKMMPYESNAKALALMEALALGQSANLPAIFGSLDRPLSANMVQAIVRAIADGAKVNNLSFEYRRLTGEFMGRIEAIKPTRRGGGYENVLSMRVEVAASIDKGLRAFDVKRQNFPKIIQVASNTSGSVTLKVDIVDLENLMGGEGLDKILTSAAGEVAGNGGLVEFGGDFGRVSGSIAADNTEMSNQLSGTIRFEVVDPAKITILAGRGRTSVRGQRVSVVPQAVKQAFEAAVLTAMLGGGGLSLAEGDASE